MENDKVEERPTLKNCPIILRILEQLELGDRIVVRTGGVLWWANNSGELIRDLTLMEVAELNRLKGLLEIQDA